MALNALIPLQAERVKVRDPVENYAAAMQLAGGMEQLRQARQAQEIQNRLMAELQGGARGPSGEIDLNRLSDIYLRYGDPKTALALQREGRAVDKEEREARKAKLEEEAAVLDTLARIAPSINSQEALDATIARFEGQGHTWGSLPRQWSPELPRQLEELALTGFQRRQLEAGALGREQTQKYQQAQLGLARERNEIARNRAGIYVDPEGGVSIGGQIGQVRQRKQATKEGEEVGKYFGETYVTLQKAADTSVLEDDKLRRLDQLLDQVTTGKFAGTTTEIKKAAKSLGVDLEALGVADNVAPAEAAQALSREMALQLRNPAGGAGMPGALSDQDRIFLESMLPGLETTREGRKAMIETRRKLNQRSREVAKMARDYRKQHGALDEGFQDALAQHAERNPIFAIVETDADYDALKSGQTFMAPDGSIRTKP